MQFQAKILKEIELRERFTLSLYDPSATVKIIGVRAHFFWGAVLNLPE